MSDESEERLGRLVHDLRTPLTVVAGFAELLAARGPGLSDAQRKEYCDRIASGALEMRAILDAERSTRDAP